MKNLLKLMCVSLLTFNVLGGEESQLKEKIDKVEMRLVIKLGGIISFWASVLLTLMKV